MKCNSKKQREDISPFILKLYSLMENEKNDNIISWNQQGDSIIIKNEELLTKQMLPKYFRHHNFKSFYNQLISNGFNDKNLQGGQHQLYNPLFKKINRQLSIKIRRIADKDDGNNQIQKSFSKNFLEGLESIIQKQNELEANYHRIQEQNIQIKKENKQLKEILKSKCNQKESFLEKYSEVMQQRKFKNPEDIVWRESASESKKQSSNNGENRILNESRESDENVIPFEQLRDYSQQLNLDQSFHN